MGMAVGGPEGGPKSEINITPLVDVCLVLLIIFMVVTPMLQRNKDVVLPKASHTDERSKEEDPLTISITSDGALWIGNNRLNKAEIRGIVQAWTKEHPGQVVLVKGDERLKMSVVRDVMHEVQEAGASSVGLGVDKPEESK